VRIAIVSDIHGNLPALQAVLDDLTQVGPDRVYVNGDVVNRGPQSKECLDRVRALGWPVVFGNHEEYVLKFRHGTWGEDGQSPFWLPVRRLAEDELTADDIAYLERLPHSWVIALPGLPPIRLVHGSMRALNEGLGPWLDDDELLAAVDGASEPVIIGAHTHRPFERRVGTRWIINSGAVGMPYNGNPAAQYLVLTAANGEWQAQFRAVPYDRAPVYEAWARTGYLELSVSARLMVYELETATYHFGPYFDFCEQHGYDRNDPQAFAAYQQLSREVIPGRPVHQHLPRDAR
jgi:predicted phosphodiesterase